MTNDINDLLTHPYKWRRVKRDGKNVVQKYIEVALYSAYDTFSVEDLAARVREEGAEDPELEVGTATGTYGDSDYGVLNVKGWRAASELEINTALEEIADARATRENFEARQIERLRASRPELFK